jgi:single-strand DNA-binding protein
MNKVILLGRCGTDPEIKSFDWGKLGRMSLATSESFTNKQKEKVNKTTWHNLIFYSQTETLEKYVHKGDQLLVEGHISVRTYKDKENNDQWAYEIFVDRFELIGSAPKKEEKKESDVNPNDLPF